MVLLMTFCQGVLEVEGRANGNGIFYCLGKATEYMEGEDTAQLTTDAIQLLVNGTVERANAGIYRCECLEVTNVLWLLHGQHG